MKQFKNTILLGKISGRLYNLKIKLNPMLNSISIEKLRIDIVEIEKLINKIKL